MKLRVAFRDERALLRIPDLIVEDVTPTVVSEHCAPYLRKHKGWWVELDVWSSGGLIHLPKKHNIVITVSRA
jgi:hypothetical protein